MLPVREQCEPFDTQQRRPRGRLSRTVQEIRVNEQLGEHEQNDKRADNECKSGVRIQSNPKW